MELIVDISKKLKDFTLKINFAAGRDTLGVLGASGSGKSMTLRCIAGLVHPDQGRIVLNGRVLFDSEQNVNIPVQARRVGLLFQNYALFPNLTVKENIAFGLKRMARNEQERKIKDIMEIMGLTALQDRKPHQISGGEQQRTALARTLVTEPDCLLLDEPFSALDNHIRSRLEKELKNILSAYRGPIVYVTHNLKECYRLSKNIMMIEKGKVLSIGSRDDIFQSPGTVQAARLTGCKNITPIKYGAERMKIRAVNWGCELMVGEDRRDATHIGIREHHIRLVEDPNEPNTFPAWAEQITETPFAVIMFMRLDNQAADSELLQLTLTKEDYRARAERPYPWFVQLKPEHLFLMAGD